MSWYEAIILGVLQGITEFLPISSSAHLFIVSQFFGWTDPGAAFTAVSQIGTELAVIVYFWRDITRIVSTWSRSLRNPVLRKELDARMGWYVIVGTIPVRRPWLPASPTKFERLRATFISSPPP